MFKAMTYLAVLILFASCANGTAHENQKDKPKKKASEKSDSSLLQCKPKNDTLISQSNFIKYVVVDSFYTVRLMVNGLDTLLPYQFDCSTPRGLVPSFYSFEHNVFCLLRGHGFDYREFIIAFVEADKIVLKQYEGALITQLKSNIVVYRNSNHLSQVIVENFRNGSRRTFTIPTKFVANEILASSIEKNHLQLQFSNASTFSIRLR